jgi:hypothetical protein
VSNQRPPLPNTEAILGWAFLGGIVIMTALAFVFAGIMPAEQRLDNDIAYLLAAVLFFAGITSMIFSRGVLLPKAAANSITPPGSAASLGYSFAESPAIFGFVLAIMTGKAWLALPFGGLALISWLIVKSYLNGLATSNRDLEFPRI